MMRADLAHDTKVALLRSLIEQMAQRYAWSEADRTAAMLAGDSERTEKYRRRRDWQFSALRRLIKALAGLAEGGAR